MKITVHAKPQAREESVEKIGPYEYIVSVKEVPSNGRANRALVHVLAHHFHTAPSCIRILAGHASRTKIVEVLE